jgi:hypothetical protein
MKKIIAYFRSFFMNTPSESVTQWLVDSALFIDDKQINKLHEAIVKPEFELVSSAEGSSENAKKTTENRWKLGADVGGTLIEIVKAKLKVGYQRNTKKEDGQTDSKTENFIPVNSPERKLEELAALYELGNVNGTGHKLVHSKFDINSEITPQWYSDYSKRVPSPKPLCFFELPAGACLIPTAAEFEDGTVAMLFSDFQKMLTTEKGGPAEKYPEPQPNVSEEELLQNRKAYWESYISVYSATKAMICIEKACAEHGKIKWIDFRLPIASSGETLHLHIVANEEYHTGTFAYNFVKRFYKHGGKVVGMLKAEPDLNVLAIYEN